MTENDQPASASVERSGADPVDQGGAPPVGEVPKLGINARERIRSYWPTVKAGAVWTWQIFQRVSVVLWGLLVALVRKFGYWLLSMLRALAPTSVLLWASGVVGSRLGEVNQQEERQVFISQGAVVFLTASFAFIAAFYFFSLVFPARAEIWNGIVHPMALAISVIWASAIFFIDRMMLQTMLGHENKKFFVGFFRISLAIMVGIVIAHPLKLQLLRADLAAIYDKNRQLYFEEASDEATQLVGEIEARTLTDAELLVREQIEIQRFVDKANEEINRIAAIALAERSGQHTDESVAVSLPLAKTPVIINPGPTGTQCEFVISLEGDDIQSLTNGYDDITVQRRNFVLLNEPNNLPAQEILQRMADGQRWNRDSRRNRSDANNNGNAAPSNCVLFAWIENQWDEARKIALNFLDPNVVSGPERRVIEARLRSEEARLNAVNARAKCFGVMAVFTISEQTDIEFKERTGEVLTSQETEKLNCARDYKSFSFLHQTELLFANAKLFESRASQGEVASTAGSQEQENRAGTIALISYGLTLLIVFIETLPVVFKLMAKPGPYELQVRREKAVAQAEATGKLDFVLSRQERAKIAKKEYLAWLEEEVMKDSVVGFRTLRREFMSRRAALAFRNANGEDLAQQIAALENEYEQTVAMLVTNLDQHKK